MTRIFNLSLLLYLAALLVAAVYLFRKAPSVGRRGDRSAGRRRSGADGLHGPALGRRGPRAIQQHVRVAGAVCLGRGGGLSRRFARGSSRLPGLGAATALLAVLTLAYASTYESDIQPLMPALRSNWLTVHVFTCFLGYGGFAVSFLAAIGYLVAARERQPGRPGSARRAGG